MIDNRTRKHANGEGSPMANCQNPKPTQKTLNPGTGPLAWCPGCNSFKPAAQVPWGQEKRNLIGDIIATYAPVPHEKEVK